MDFLEDIISLLEQAINEDCPIQLSGGGIIRAGYDSQVDEMNYFLEHGQEWLAKYQSELQEQLSIQNLKIKYTGNTGYFIEVPRSAVEKVPESFIHKQTLTNAARYSSPELQEYERKSISIQSDLFSREYELFLQIRNSVLGHFYDISKLSEKIANIDFLTNGALISQKFQYISPEISPSRIYKIQWGKHPVLAQQTHDFVSNDLHLTNQDRIHTITGPNMGGKSTYLRQNALLILLAHMGYDIPAHSAEIALTDAIFSRVGAGDNLFLGQSTFMVEMQEISYILKHATQRSFIIIDEIGRGTSTYDGMSLAWSILEYIHTSIGASCLFATHYHEIIDHVDTLTSAHNYSIAVGENDKNIVFLRKVIPGAMKKSYGIHVAKLAGVPQEVLSGAKNMLDTYEKQQHFWTQLSLGEIPSMLELTQNSEELKKREKQNFLIHELGQVDINSLTPLQALQTLAQFQQKAK